MPSPLMQDIKFLTGVGPKRAELLYSELGVNTFHDLLYYFPYKYVDRTKFYTIREINGNMPYVQVIGKIVSFEKVGEGSKTRLSAVFADKTGTLELIWFKGIKWVMQNVQKNKAYILFGKPSLFSGRLNIVHPELDEITDAEEKVTGSIQAFYNTSEKMKKNYLSSKGVLKLQANLMHAVRNSISETLPSWFTAKYKMMPLPEALKAIHFPENVDQLRKAQYRLKLEELFYIQLKILSLKSNRSQKFRGHVFGVIGEYFNRFFHECLPFEMTGAQKKVIREIRKDVASGKQMNRLLQGDVGSGKTLVALMCMLMAIDNGTQACLMAPTEILAIQHYQTLSKMLEPLGLNVKLLKGSTKTKERRVIHEELIDGSVNILVGTHALIESKVVFQNLGFVVIDEQHRFGVAQRAKLWNKNTVPPHVLVMTATPIPRTLAMTVYGDLDVSVIDELPPGRKPIKTLHFYDSKRKQVFQFLREEINRGRQVYIVYPLIEESEKLDLKNLQQGYETVKKVFPDLKVSMVHGRLSAQDKDEEMRRFKNHETQIMVSTTVIEVGVDVPNASVMVIESAERFGLSQLHQLRGRVGRGAEQSYCILMSSYKLSKESTIRLETMVRTNDGFEIAETDLKLRGPGDIEGTQQSGLGLNLRIANISRDGELLQFARNIASDIIDADAALQNDDNTMFKKQLLKMKNTQFNWSVIS
ncbi:MAG TPA: ATP-dependent DNA helicase RecG [Prolixibacteraceae bacterium]|nr:ATP-dependent DNA helicase RecG [Prolixibacteraceae bacterium]HPR60519.1 ATP-dependent DNA helicase RecG [Prolixibacteraceae bacterium]